MPRHARIAAINVIDQLPFCQPKNGKLLFNSAQDNFPAHLPKGIAARPNPSENHAYVFPARIFSQDDVSPPQKMGLYWATYAYYGRLCSLRAVDRLLEHGVPGRFLKRMSEKYYVLHVPGRLVKMGTLDPVLEKHEKNTGRVSLDEFYKWLGGSLPEEKLVWENVSEADLDTLKELVKVASGGREEEEPAVYICEIAWDTYFLGEDEKRTGPWNIKCI